MESWRPHREEDIQWKRKIWQIQSGWLSERMVTLTLSI